MPGALLEVESLTKRFGGLTAVNKVSFGLAHDGIVGRTSWCR
jgi:ABC-type branched-subunit amino acid transport system ATPase component